MPDTAPQPTGEALLSMLFPLWQIVIALVVLLVVLVAAWRLARRGPSRMTTAVIVLGAAVIGVNVVGILLS